jgi:hypothetical protein
MVTQSKHNSCQKLCEHYEQLLWQYAGSNSTNPRSIFSSNHARLRTLAEDDIQKVVNMPTNDYKEFQILNTDADTDATTTSLTENECVDGYFQYTIHGIALNVHNLVQKEYSTGNVKFGA